MIDLINSAITIFTLSIQRQIIIHQAYYKVI
jgi:hypothetical protein